MKLPLKLNSVACTRLLEAAHRPWWPSLFCVSLPPLGRVNSSVMLRIVTMSQLMASAPLSASMMRMFRIQALPQPLK
jgi:hypothetical protein